MGRREMGLPVKGQNEDSCDEDILYPAYYHVNTVFVIMYYSFITCYYVGNWAKGTWNLSIVFLITTE